LAGRRPRAKGIGLETADLVNRFLTIKKDWVDTREPCRRAFDDYYATCDRLVKAFGRNRLVLDLAAEDFERLRVDLGKTWGPVSVNNEIGRQRVIGIARVAHRDGLNGDRSSEGRQGNEVQGSDCADKQGANHERHSQGNQGNAD